MSKTGTLASSSARPDAAHPAHGVLHALLGIAPREALFEARGFAPGPAQPLLESAGGSFVAGYNLALGERADTVDAALALRPVHLRGFFAEGAAMGAAIAGLAMPWRRALPELLEQLGDRYVHLLHVGVGWAIARVPVARALFTRPLDPLLRWLALDGRGFHDGYFHAPRIVAGWRAVAGATTPIYDQGVGRSLWFSCGSDTGRIAATVAALPAERAGDLWAGVGLASVYAGGAAPDALDALAPGEARRWFRQGAAFAISAHARAGTPPAGSIAAAERMTGLPWSEVVDLVAEAEAAARASGAHPLDRYHLWRSLIAEFIEQRGA